MEPMAGEGSSDEAGSASDPAYHPAAPQLRGPSKRGRKRLPEPNLEECADPDVAKVVRRRQRNRENAASSRARKAQELQELKERVERLEARNEALARDNAAKQALIGSLTRQLEVARGVAPAGGSRAAAGATLPEPALVPGSSGTAGRWAGGGRSSGGGGSPRGSLLRSGSLPASLQPYQNAAEPSYLAPVRGGTELRGAGQGTTMHALLDASSLTPHSALPGTVPGDAQGAAPMQRAGSFGLSALTASLAAAPFMASASSDHSTRSMAAAQGEGLELAGQGAGQDSGGCAAPAPTRRQSRRPPRSGRAAAAAVAVDGGQEAEQPRSMPATAPGFPTSMLGLTMPFMAREPVPALDPAQAGSSPFSAVPYQAAPAAGRPPLFGSPGSSPAGASPCTPSPLAQEAPTGPPQLPFPALAPTPPGLRLCRSGSCPAPGAALGGMAGPAAGLGVFGVPDAACSQLTSLAGVDLRCPASDMLPASPLGAPYTAAQSVAQHATVMGQPLALRMGGLEGAMPSVRTSCHEDGRAHLAGGLEELVNSPFSSLARLAGSTPHGGGLGAGLGSEGELTRLLSAPAVLEDAMELGGDFGGPQIGQPHGHLSSSHPLHYMSPPNS